MLDRMCCCNLSLKANGMATAMLRRVAWVPALYCHRVARSDDSYLAAWQSFRVAASATEQGGKIAASEWRDVRVAGRLRLQALAAAADTLLAASDDAHLACTAVAALSVCA